MEPADQDLFFVIFKMDNEFTWVPFDQWDTYLTYNLPRGPGMDDIRASFIPEQGPGRQQF